MIETLINAAVRPFGYDCHVMFGAVDASDLEDPARSFLGFSFTACGPTDSVYRGLGVTVIVSSTASHLRVHPRSA